MVDEQWIGAVLPEQPHDTGFAEACREPERCRSHELGVEIEILRRSPKRSPSPKRRIRVGAVREKRGRDPFVAAHDGFVQSSKAGTVRIWVRAALEQKLDHLRKS